MEAQLKDLRKLQARFPNGLRVSKQIIGTEAITIDRLFDSTDTIPSIVRALPTPAFLVPAILDALSTSIYAPVTKLVAAEADLFCAQAAHRSGCIILTSDSDLLVYDLGEHGKIVFFDHLMINAAESLYHCSILNVLTWQPSDIARRLGLRESKCLAFQIKQDPSIGLLEAVQRAALSESLHDQKQDLVTEKTEQNKNAFLDFCKEYEIEPTSTGTHVHGPKMTTEISLDRQVLDPRLSELALASSNLPNVYCPFIFEDPSRTSAWTVSRHIRILAYSCLFSNVRSHSSCINEFHRQGQRITAEKIQLLSPDEIVAHIDKFVTKFEKLRRFFSGIPELIMWRMYGLYEIHHWNFINYECFPPAELARYALTGLADGTVCWATLHFSAQMQAILGSVRILRQVFEHMKIVTAIEKSNKTPFFCNSSLAIENVLKTLPPIQHLMSSRAELEAQDLPTDDLLHNLFTMLEVSLGLDLKPYKELFKREDSNANKDPSTTASQSSHTRPKKTRKGKKYHSQEVAARVDASSKPQNNSFSVLDNI